MSDSTRSTGSGSTSKKSKECRVLVIDDNTRIHDDFKKILLNEEVDVTLDELDANLFGKEPAASKSAIPNFDLDFASQGKEGYEKICDSIKQNNPYSVAFVDVRMPPGWDGVETVSKILDVESKIQIVFCTAYSDYAIEDILERFGLSDRVMVLQKPFDPVELQSLTVSLTQKWSKMSELSRVGRTQSDTLKRATALLDVTQKANQSLLEEKRIYTADAEQLSRALDITTTRIAAAEDTMILAIATVVEARDAEMGDHLKRMQKIAQIIAERLREDSAYQDQIDDRFLHDFFRSTPLHDIGKIGIPDGILLKAGSLTEAEYEIMKQHSIIGYDIIKKTAEGSPFFKFMDMAADIARHHHESFDGSGYPDGLKGTAIPLSARIASVADAFDAMTSNRIYQKAIPYYEARRRVEDANGTQFDPEVVEAFGFVFADICDATRELHKLRATTDS